MLKSKATDLIGDGWTVEVIKHILSFMLLEMKKVNKS